MGLVERVLPNNALETLAAAEEHGAGIGLKAARGVPADTAIEVLRDAGLRGRGGAGFPTWRKWRTVADFEVPGTPTTVVVNAAEGEPGCFKDRLILRRNPYAVLEGALIAAHAVAADRVIVATKSSFTNEIDRVDRAITEIEQAGWTEGIDVSIFRGPGEYLYGEETGLLEAIDGRPPFPRVAPPYRHGVDEEVDDAREPAGRQLVARAHRDGRADRRERRAADARAERRDARERARPSSPTAPSGSAAWAPVSHPARSCAR